VDTQEPEQKASKQQSALSRQRNLAAFAFARVVTGASRACPERSRRVQAERNSAAFPALANFPATGGHKLSSIGTEVERPKGNLMPKVNIAEKFAKIHDYYKPRIAAELNGQYVKFVKFDSPFVFHHHDHEDEMFLVVKGRFRMEFRDRHEWIETGEFIVVPRGVEHRPVAEEECCVLLFEPATTLNTGNIENERTVHELERV
jgi:mannose-6-phosphate isomerase-like protein (cupin superfamily)